jgi:hypothetical protein
MNTSVGDKDIEAGQLSVRTLGEGFHAGKACHIERPNFDG